MICKYFNAESDGPYSHLFSSSVCISVYLCHLFFPSPFPLIFSLFFPFVPLASELAIQSNNSTILCRRCGCGDVVRDSVSFYLS